jgi:dUTP pyrophosphatase
MDTKVTCYDTSSAVYADNNNYNTSTYSHSPAGIPMVLHTDYCKPEYKTKGAAGADLKSVLNLTLAPGAGHLISTGVSLAIPEGFVGLVFPRSGLASKGITLKNSVGVIDSDYRGEIMVSLVNNSYETVEINKGDRIAQIVFLPVTQFPFISVDKLPETVRGTGGFGSTGGN